MDTTENKNKKFKLGDYLKDRLQYIAIFVVSVIYIFQGFFELVQKDTTVLDILGNIALSVIVGLIITSSLNLSGLKDGANDDKFVASMKAYGEAKNRSTQYFDKLSSWCHYKNEQDLEYKKKDIIQSAGLSWKGFKVGYYDTHTDKLTEEQKKAINDAKKCQIARIKSDELLSDLPKQSVFNPNNKFGEDKEDYQRKEFVIDLITRVGMAIVCGMYVLQPIISEEALGNILWNSCQTMLWISFGIIKYFNAKSFMIDEYRHSHIILKTEYLNEFVVTMQKNPSVIDKYSNEDNEIDKFIEELISKKEVKINDQERVLD